MEKKHYIVIIVIVIAISILFLGTSTTGNVVIDNNLRTDLFFVYETVTYATSVEVVDLPDSMERLTIGMNVDTTDLNFGIIPAKAGGSHRFIDLENPEDYGVEIIFSVKGTISPFMEFEQNNFKLNGNEKKSVKIIMNAKNATPGNYSGKIDVTAKRPKITIW
ncbi:hypothetical protein ACFLQN_01440 [Candidatus Aenigmatarchaeota archaeon]